MNDYLPLLVILGLGGIVIYVLTRQQQQPPVVDKSAMANCGASYLGVGASVPCEYLAAGIKTLTSDVSKTLSPVTKQLGTATKGIKPWEVVVTPVAVSHVAYNETKAVLNYIGL